MKKFFFRLLRGFRYDFYLRLLDPSLKTLHDLGCGEGGFVKLAREIGYDARGTDIEHDIESSTQSADIVTCFQVLEHIVDPPAALRSLRALHWKQLILSVPNEPWFSLWLGASWEREHLWAVTGAALKKHLGEPVYERRILLGRYYVAVWRR